MLRLQKSLRERAVPGIEPGTSPTLRENHTTRPNSQLLHPLENALIRFFELLRSRRRKLAESGFDPPTFEL